jgi:hypothetical protein
MRVGSHRTDHITALRRAMYMRGESALDAGKKEGRRLARPFVSLKLRG